ncbi:hypothetical protein [Nitrospirillum iridis]|uniref:Uncharacterized protein n=1 Tax=Nitrospirillum iridis TaxID=765888 RepID=A0A7X0AY22_9PROT|nr:hypothetical protein [Nitrospirillum iridis]MBB6251411.1 hypothetical protein [Nitrospirillum iridis]
MTAPAALPHLGTALRTAFAGIRCAVMRATLRALSPVTWWGAFALAAGVTAAYVSFLLVFSIAMGVLHGR